jgi:hypothetical protein
MALQYTLSVRLDGKTQDEMARELVRILRWEAEVHEELGIGPGHGNVLNRGSDTKIIGTVIVTEVE